MNTARSLVALGVVLALGGSQAVWAAQQKEEDSAYQWGRWAVLSPAAGGEPYVAPQEPDAAKNARPGEANEFQPKVESVITPSPPRVGIVPINPDVPVQTTPPSVAPPPPPPVAPPLGGEA